MKLAALLGILAFAAAAGAATADSSPAPAPLRVNAQGVYPDIGVWIYQDPKGFGFTPGVKGTNESIVMPVPSPLPGTLVSVEIIRHPFDTLGYPLHISLVDKLFATLSNVEAIVSDQGNLWKHELGAPYPQEVPPKGAAPASATAVGPMPASGTIPEQYRAAFDFASNALKSIENLPDAQKDLKNYAVLFVETGDTIWIEFAPVFGPDETPHLGCQTQMGRDMVFGYLKKQAANGQTGKFLQCF